MSRSLILYFLSVISLIILGLFIYLVFATEYDILAVKIAVTILVSIVCVFLSYTLIVLARTPLPKPIEEIEDLVEKVLGEESSEDKD